MSKKKEREKLEAQVAEFLARGGKVTVCEPSETNNLDLHARDYHKLRRALDAGLVPDRPAGSVRDE
jgi:hypothetical protein